MTRKDRCKEIMGKYFGPASANMVDSLSEEDCVSVCRKKVCAFLGEEKAKAFDSI